jgi:hypothetical protein
MKISKSLSKAKEVSKQKKEDILVFDFNFETVNAFPLHTQSDHPRRFI